MASDETQASSEIKREPPLIEAQANTEAPARPQKGALSIATLMLALGALLAASASLWLGWGSGDEIASLRASVTQIEARPQPPAQNPDMVALGTRLSALEQRPQPASPAPALADLTRRAEASDQRLTQLSRDLADLRETLRQLQVRPEASTATTNAAPSDAPAVDLGPLNMALRNLDQRMSKVEGEIKALTERPAPEPRTTDTASLAVIAQAIQHAIDQAQPFSALVDAAAKLGASQERLMTLRQAAQNGTASTRALAQSWSQSTRSVLETLQDKPASDSTLLDRLKSSASQLVRVRPVGEALGEDPASLMARIDAALAQGAIAPAYAAWQKLPEAAQAASKSFGELAQKRLQAEAAARALAESALQALTKGAP